MRDGDDYPDMSKGILIKVDNKIFIAIGTFEKPRVIDVWEVDDDD